MTIKILPFKMGSKSGKDLKEALIAEGNAVHRVSKDSQSFRPRKHHKIINWGCSQPPTWQSPETHIYNPPAAVALATNKLACLTILQDNGVNVPPFTTDFNEAEGWVNDNKPVLARTKLNAHSGDGIIIISAEDNFINAPLYTQYIKKRYEFRVHICDGQVFDEQVKRRRLELDYTEEQGMIRSYTNGWVFTRDFTGVPPLAQKKVCDEAVKAVEVLGLDFGAVDVIYNGHYNTAYVLEVNTAPALEGTTLGNYVEALSQLVGN